MKKVSVIVPVYNVQDYIEKCLDSLVYQTLEDIEIIVVNDGSTDESKIVVQKYINKYPEKIIYVEKENGGLSDARNYGMKYATGEYIAFVDSDDYVEKDMYEKMYEKAKKEDSDMVECNFYWEYPKKLKLDKGIKYKVKQDMLVKVRVVAWNKLIKRSILNETKIEFPKGLRYEDVEFTYKLIPYINKVSFVTEPMVHYIQRQNSISNMQNSRNGEIFNVLDNVIKYYEENKLYEEYKIELEYIYTRYLLCSSFLRIVKIKDKKVRKQLLNETWNNLNSRFPNWKNNKILKKGKSKKDRYIKSVNKITFKIYGKLFRIKKQ